eukprot:COSAG01_NODE_2213_length_8163_cov_18.627327_3_plen_165_part_00
MTNTTPPARSRTASGSGSKNGGCLPRLKPHALRTAAKLSPSSCAAAAAAAAATAQQEQLELEQQQQQEQELELEPELEPVPTLEAVAAVEPGDGGWTPAPKRGEEFMTSPPGDEPSSPAVRLRRFQLLECLHSSGDTTVIDRDKVRGGTHTHTSGVRPTSGISL